MNDLISREAACRQVCKHCNRMGMDHPAEMTANGYRHSTQDGFVRCEADGIRALPSLSPPVPSADDKERAREIVRPLTDGDDRYTTVLQSSDAESLVDRIAAALVDARKGENKDVE